MAEKKKKQVDTAAQTAAAHQAARIFETPEDFVEAANKYFDECDASGTLYGEAGLCLGLTKYNSKGKNVSLDMLRNWYDGTWNAQLKGAVQNAYLRIQSQIETDPRYQEKGGMATRSIFLQKQARFGGYQDKIEEKKDHTIRIVHGNSMDESDFK